MIVYDNEQIFVVRLINIMQRVINLKQYLSINHLFML
jgi:hypothetical protein